MRPTPPIATAIAVTCAVLSLALAACKGGGPDPQTPAPTPPGTEGSADEGATEDGSGGAADEGSAGFGPGVSEGSGVARMAAPEPEPEASLSDLAQGHGPLDPAVREVIWGVHEDEVPEVLNATREDLENRHYLTCDELNLHVWYEQVKDLGGAYAGVGSDQAYTFIGWQRPSIAWLTDYDPWVRTVHKIYLLAFETAEDNQAFRDFWNPDNYDETWEAIRERWEGDRDERLFRPVWRDWHSRIYWRLIRYNRTLNDAEIPWFLNDDEHYAFVRDFVLSGRVRPLLANLLDDAALMEIGEVSRELQVPIRVYYLSNAEDYWNYPDQFRENFLNLHFDEQSLILRTNATKRQNGDYRYMSQGALNFQEWLRQDFVRRIGHIWPYPAVRDEEHIPTTFMPNGTVPEER